MSKHWIFKFRCALRGIGFGTRGQSSFRVHLPAAALVLALAFALRCNAWQFAVLGLCIALVLCMELMNSALESLARGLCHEQNAEVGQALDIASGAVLLASLAAATIGGAIFVYQWSVLSF